VDLSAQSLTAQVDAASYRVQLRRLGISREDAEREAAAFLAKDSVMLTKRVKKKRGEKLVELDIRQLVREIAVTEHESGVCLDVVVGRHSGNLGRPRELLAALFGTDPKGALEAKTHKLDSFVPFDGRLVSAGAGWGAERFDPWRAPSVAAAV
jgi:hypothetical protein